MSALRRPIIVILGAALALVPTSRASADDGASTHDAAKHFSRAVALYGEADYRAALVEFKRAYAIAPNTAVLYNIGEAEYQLQDYASALVTFEHYLAEAPPNEAHHAEVESNVDILRARVGHISVTTIPGAADVFVDDQPAGRTPIDKPVLVSIGHRKITASLPGRPPITRYVDVAADDNVVVTLQLPQPQDASSSSQPLPSFSHSADPPPHPHSNATLHAVEWIGAGALAAGALTFGALAIHSSDQLKDDRASFPTTATTLNHDASLTTTYSIVADSLGGAALVLGGIALVSTLTSPSPQTTGATQPGTRVMLGPGSARLEVTF
jgi:tetratricopeptide (TPR) repeat protein